MNNDSMKNIVGTFIESYAQRDKNADFTEWLTDAVSKEMPDISQEDASGIVSEIMNGVSQYDRTLDDLNDAIGKGQTKEEWFSARMAESYADMPVDAVGEKLCQLDNSFDTSAVEIFNELDDENRYELQVIDGKPAEWNKFSVKDKEISVRSKLLFAGLGAAAKVLKDKAENGEEAPISASVKEAFQEGLSTDPYEVKAAVAGAVRVAAEKGLSDSLPANTSAQTICDMAGAAVEGAKAVCDAASGDISAKEAAERVGKASVAAGCHYGAGFLRNEVMLLPYGHVLADLLGGLFDYLESTDFINAAYNMLRSAAIATFEGMKNSRIVKTAKKAINKTKEAVKNFLFN